MRLESIGRDVATSGKATQRTSGSLQAGQFRDLLAQQLRQRQGWQLKLSGHFQERLERREVDLSEHTLSRITGRSGGSGQGGQAVPYRGRPASRDRQCQGQYSGHRPARGGERRPGLHQHRQRSDRLGPVPKWEALKHEPRERGHRREQVA